MTPCFDDWKRFCFVLREIARGGDDGRPLPNFEAQRRAQAVLTECGYAWRRVMANGGDKIPEANESPDKATDSVEIVNGKTLPSATVNPTRARLRGGRRAGPRERHRPG
jgi:hypothetical protein